MSHHGAERLTMVGHFHEGQSRNSAAIEPKLTGHGCAYRCLRFESESKTYGCETVWSHMESFSSCICFWDFSRSPGLENCRPEGHTVKSRSASR